MKYDSLRNPKRDAMIRDYCKGHPEESLDEIGRIYGISRQRVSQILQAAGMSRRTRRKRNAA